ncbi:MAG: hypothetical protein GWN29_09815 [Gammaproteobacteria bacterium]|nr:hypothetical protein [Gammaproteobacteria bacterium]
MDVGDDVFALAVTTYELLCGQLPFGRSPDDRVLETPPTPVLEIQPAYSDELKVVELAAFIDLLLAGNADVDDRPLDALDALLAAIIAGHD